MTPPQPATVLDLRQLREVTLNDDDLMREILAALLEDTSRHTPLLEAAVEARDSSRVQRLAHYGKGACANVGAKAAAAALEQIERRAAAGDFDQCRASLIALGRELDRLREEAAALF